MAAVASPENRAVSKFFLDILSEHSQTGKFKHARLQLEEFEDCRYDLEIAASQPGIAHMTFSTADQISEGAVSLAESQYQNMAAVRCSEDRQALEMEVSLSWLSHQSQTEQHDAVRSLASIRSALLGYPLRRAMEDTAAGSLKSISLSIKSRPHCPFFVNAAEETLSVTYPIWPRNKQHDLLLTAFIQEFTDARRAPGMSDAPQCHVTFPGQMPAVSLSKEQRQLLGSFSGMFLTVVLGPRHFSSPAKIEKAAWMLLTFYRQMDLHVQSFKALIHSKMRATANGLLTAMENAQDGHSMAHRLS